MVHLKGLTNLKILEFLDSTITDTILAEIARLREALPDCKIIWGER